MRSSIAHLFQFYDVLCDIAAIPRKTPSAWVMAEAPSPISPSSPVKGSGLSLSSRTRYSGQDGALQLDARVLARECLKLVGQEIGIDRHK